MNQFLRSVWMLRYRVYALLAIFLCLPVLYSTNANLPPNVIANGYTIEQSNFLAQRIARTLISATEERLPQTETNNSSRPDVKSEYDFTSQDIMSKLAEAGFQAGFINAQTIRDIGKTVPVPERKELLTLDQIKRNREITGRLLNDIFPQPDSPPRSNFLRIPNYNINAPVIYASFEDMFEKEPDGKINFFKPRDTSDINSPLQVLLRDGVVCLPISPFPGDVGNSYCVGHSSNYSFVRSNFNEVLKPIERKGNVGEEIILFDPYGRELKFRIFETQLIEETEGDVAYKNFGKRRVLTLQTSVVSFRPERGFQPYQRWLVRGELICPDGNPCQE